MHHNKRSMNDYLIFTDLDGTLLDHDNYCFNAAKPSLRQLTEKNIPVVINSSKTSDEIKELRHQLQNPHPFIIENGSAIYTPHHYFQTIASHTDSIVKDGYDTTILGESREQILKVIDHIMPSASRPFTQYSRSSIQDIQTMTGLSKTEAKKSANRYYTEPLIWLGSEEEKQDFIQQLTLHGLHTLQGGRFLHVMGKTDKGQAINALTQQYQARKPNSITTIALGDSHNDIAMLQAADIAVVIRSPHYDPPVFEHPNKMISHAYGPAGWHECIQSIIFTEQPLTEQ